MMIGCRRRPGKEICQRFVQPPWDRTSTEWLKIDEQLEANHLARVVDRGVNVLDVKALFQSYAGRGSKAYRPDLMLKMVLFEIHRGRTSPAQWHLDAKENVALQWLGRGIRPARSVWYEFAFRIHRFGDDWNREVLHKAVERGQVLGERVAQDGTMVEAHASRHHLLNHEQLQQRRQVLEETIKADETGSEPPPPPYWIAQTPETRAQQRDRYQVAHTKLTERLAENRKRQPSKQQEEKNVRISVTDPEAALGKDKHKVFRPLYNVQYVRDLDSPFIVGYDTFARSSDTGTLKPLMARTQQLTGRKPKDVLVDSGYITALDLADAETLGVALYGPWKENDHSDKAKPAKQWSKDKFHWSEPKQEYRCPQRRPLRLIGVQNRPRSLERTEKLEIYRADAATCARCPQKTRCCPKSKSGRNLHRSEHEALIEAHRRKMETPEAKALYKLRRQTVETSFGDSKQHRNFRRLNGRGLLKAKTQTSLTVLAHNTWEFVKEIQGADWPKQKS